MCEFCTVAFKNLFHVSLPNFNVTDCMWLYLCMHLVGQVAFLWLYRKLE